MALSTNHALAREAVFFGKIESTPGTLDNPYASANAIRHLPGATGFDLQIPRDDVDEARSTRSLEERTTNKGTIAWTYGGYCRPSGTAGTAPDIGAILEAALGTATNTGGTRERYTLSDSQLVKTLSLGIETGILSETIWGAYVNQLTIAGSGGDRPQITAAGGALGYAFTGQAVVDGAASAGATFDVTAGTAGEIEEGSIVQFSTGGNNGGAGYEVTGVSGATYTVSPAHGGLSNAEVVSPLIVTPTTVGAPLPGIAGTATVGGTTYPLRGYSITIDNQITEVADEVGEAFSTDVIPGFRMVSGSLDFRSRADALELFGDRRSFASKAVVITVGEDAGSKIVITMPAVEVEFSAFERSAEDSLLFSLPFRALASTAPDEIQIDFE